MFYALYKEEINKISMLKLTKKICDSLKTCHGNSRDELDSSFDFKSNKEKCNLCQMVNMDEKPGHSLNLLQYLTPHTHYDEDEINISYKESFIK